MVGRHASHTDHGRPNHHRTAALQAIGRCTLPTVLQAEPCTPCGTGRPPAVGSAAFAALATAWTRGYEAFLRSRMHLLALRDPHIAINTGTMLLRPSASIHALGVATLRARRFNFTHGFDLIGRPRSVLPLESVARADVKRLRDSRMFRMNTWDVVCGDADQGACQLLGGLAVTLDILSDTHRIIRARALASVANAM